MTAAQPTERQVQRAILQMIGVCFRETIYHHSPNGAHLAGNNTSRLSKWEHCLATG